VVARRLDGADQIIDREAPCIEGDGRMLGCEVNRRAHLIQLVEALLDAGRARRAGHPVDHQLDMLDMFGWPGLGGGRLGHGGHHAAS
jgi:hypothetical protein